MKILPYFAGMLTGIGLTSLLLAFTRPEAPAFRPGPPGPRREIAARESKRTQNPTPISPAPVPAGARRKLNPFFLNFAFSGAPATKGLSAEDVADPQFIEAYRRAVRLSARKELTPWASLLRLAPRQFDALVEVETDQALAYRSFDDANPGRAAMTAKMAELSALAEARLGAVLTPDQMDKLAGMSLHDAQIAAESMDSFAAHDAPLSSEQAARLSIAAVATSFGPFFKYTFSSGPAESGMTSEQSRLLANQQRWAEAAAFKHSLASIRVRDPEVADLWPGR